MSAPIVIAGFPITDEIGLKRHDQHFDVPFEISNHGRDQSDYLRGAQGTWCYYVTISEQMVDADTFAKFWLPPASFHKRSNDWEEPSYDYWNAEFSAVHWHGGVTYFSKSGGIDGTPRAVKIGCDFAHHWDSGHRYDYADVEREARQTIDELRERYVFLRRCAWSGKWLPESEMVETKSTTGRAYLISKERAAEKAAEDAAKAEGSTL